MATARTRRRNQAPPTKAPAAVLQDELVEELGQLPYVTRVLWDDADNDIVVWIVIEAPRFDERFRFPIYEIELQLIRRHPGLDFRFRLLNVVEFGVEHVMSLLPPEAPALISR